MSSGIEITLMFTCASCGKDDSVTFITFVNVVDARTRYCLACLRRPAFITPDDS